MNYKDINQLFEGYLNENFKNKLFAEIDGKKKTYIQLIEDVKKLFKFFDERGLKKGDHIILSTKEDYYTSLFFLAFLRYGIVTVLVDPDAPLARFLAIQTKVKPKGFVMDDNLFEPRKIIVDEDLFQIKIKKLEQKKGFIFNKLLGIKKTEKLNDTQDLSSILENLNEFTPSIPFIDEEHIAYILFTSGTTDQPKGVVISHKNLFTHLNTLSKVYSLDDNVRILNILMLYHADGSIQGPLLSFYNNATWIRPFSFDLSKINELFLSIYKYKITHFIAVPTLLTFMDKFSEGFEDSFQTLDFKFIVSCASKLEKKLWNEFESKFKTSLLNVYGLTETVAGSLFTQVDSNISMFGTEGIAVDCETKIVKLDGNNAKFDEIGEIYLKGEHIFMGYFNDDEATAKVLKEGWFNTGDLAYKDAEGLIHITGRSKNTINSGGINIYPEQITEMINTHPDILESVCLGVEDENFGEKVVCAYVLTTNNFLEKIDLINFLRPLLEYNQIPKQFYNLKTLPKGLSGKVLLNDVKSLILDFTINKNVELESDYELVIRNIASEAFGVKIENIAKNDTSYTLEGWDSMAHLVFVTLLEKHFNVTFSTADMLTMNSLVTAHRILVGKLNKK